MGEKLFNYNLSSESYKGNILDTGIAAKALSDARDEEPIHMSVSLIKPEQPRKFSIFPKRPRTSPLEVVNAALVDTTEAMAKTGVQVADIYGPEWSEYLFDYARRVRDAQAKKFQADTIETTLTLPADVLKTMTGDQLNKIAVAELSFCFEISSTALARRDPAVTTLVGELDKNFGEIPIVLSLDDLQYPIQQKLSSELLATAKVVQIRPEYLREIEDGKTKEMHMMGDHMRRWHEPIARNIREGTRVILKSQNLPEPKDQPSYYNKAIKIFESMRVK